MDNLNNFSIELKSIEDGKAHVIVTLPNKIGDLIIPDKYDGFPVTTVTFKIAQFPSIRINNLVLGNNVSNIDFEKEKYYPNSKMKFTPHWMINKISVPDSLKKLPSAFLSKSNHDTEYILTNNHPTYQIIDNVLINKKRGALLRFIDSSNTTIPENNKIKIISKLIAANIYHDTGLVIPNNIESIELDDFNGSFYIKDISKDNEHFVYKDNGIIIDPLTRTLLKYKGDSNSLDLSDEYILRIAPGDFLDNQDLTDIILPNELKTIGKFAFRGCSNLKHIQFNEKLSVINDFAFWDCSSLEKAMFKSKSLTIGANLFDGCDNLNHISYPKLINQDVDYPSPYDYVLYYPHRCKLPKIDPDLGLALILNEKHYDKITLKNDRYQLGLFTSTNETVVDKLIIDSFIEYLQISETIIIKDVVINDPEHCNFIYENKTLINKKGTLITCYIPKDCNSYSLSSKVKHISSTFRKIFNGAENIDTFIVPKEVEMISFKEDEYNTCPMPSCNNLVIENPNIELEDYEMYQKDTVEYIHVPYENLIIDVSNSNIYKIEGNYLIDKKTNYKVLPLNRSLHKKSILN